MGFVPSTHPPAPVSARSRLQTSSVAAASRHPSSRFRPSRPVTRRNGGQVGSRHTRRLPIPGAEKFPVRRFSIPVPAVRVSPSGRSSSSSTRSTSSTASAYWVLPWLASSSRPPASG